MAISVPTEEVQEHASAAMGVADAPSAGASDDDRPPGTSGPDGDRWLLIPQTPIIAEPFGHTSHSSHSSHSSHASHASHASGAGSHASHASHVSGGGVVVPPIAAPVPSPAPAPAPVRPAPPPPPPWPPSVGVAWFAGSVVSADADAGRLVVRDAGGALKGFTYDTTSWQLVGTKLEPLQVGLVRTGQPVTVHYVDGADHVTVLVLVPEPPDAPAP